MKKIILSVFVLSSVFISCKKSSTNNNVNSTASISGLTCASAVFSATATSSVQYSGTATVGYTGGNGASYAAGSAIASTGVTGLTATLQAGTLTSGSGNLSFAISGTPASSGTASFAVSFGGQSCTLNLNVTQLPLFMTTSASDKWYVEDEIDSAYCCLSTINTTGLVALPDSNVTYPGGTTPADMDYMQFAINHSYKWYIYDATSPITVNGTYTNGFSNISGADTITTNFTYNGSAYSYKFRINSVTPTNMQLRNRSFYYPSSDQPQTYNGDTLLYRFTYDFRK